MSHSTTTSKKAAKSAVQGPQQMVERLAKIKAEVKEEPVSPPRDNSNNNNSNNCNDDSDDDKPFAVKLGLVTAAPNNGNKKTRRAAAKQSSSVATAAAAAAKRAPRAYKTPQPRRNNLLKNWFDRTFKAEATTSLDDSLLPDPRKQYTEVELDAFEPVGLMFYAGFNSSAVPLTAKNKSTLHDYHARAYIPHAHRPEFDQGEWMQVVVKTTFCSRGKCDAAVVARVDDKCFPERGQRKYLKLNTNLIQLVPKTRQEIRAPFIELIRQQRQQQQSQQQAHE